MTPAQKERNIILYEISFRFCDALRYNYDVNEQWC